MKSSFFYNLAAVFYFLASIFLIGYIVYDKKDRFSALSRIFTILGLVVHTCGIIFRIIESQHAPFANLYESITYFSWVIILLYLYMEFRYQLKSLGVFIIPLSFLALIYANTLSSQIQPLVPALQSLWLEIHVAVIFIGYAAFAISYAFAIAYIFKIETEELSSSKLSIFNLAFLSSSLVCLLSWDIFSLISKLGNIDILTGNIFTFSVKKIIFSLEWLVFFFISFFVIKKREKELADKVIFLFAVLNISFVVMAMFFFLLQIKFKLIIIDILIRWGMFVLIYYVFNRNRDVLRSRFPGIDVIDRINYKAIAYGFPFLTAGIVAGAIWANEAWGSYWSWDPKETWSLITWFIYSAYLHARLTAGWKGVRAAYLSIYGFWAVIFTYFGVSLFLSGLHSYG